jgi:hypothetical protein
MDAKMLQHFLAKRDLALRGNGQGAHVIHLISHRVDVRRMHLTFKRGKFLPSVAIPREYLTADI